MSSDERLSQRLMSRQGGLMRRQMPGGGEAFTGPTANKALKTLGARAMTMDRSIIVDSGFDDSKPEDLALYAHERHHQNESGGSDNHSEYDSEERAARAQERMVLHRSKAGHGAEQIMSDIAGGRGGANAAGATDAFANMEQRGDKDESGEPDGMAAYRAMLKDGKSHREIIHELSNFVVNTLDRQRSEQALRSDGDASTDY